MIDLDQFEVRIGNARPKTIGKRAFTYLMVDVSEMKELVRELRAARDVVANVRTNLDRFDASVRGEP